MTYVKAGELSNLASASTGNGSLGGSKTTFVCLLVTMIKTAVSVEANSNPRRAVNKLAAFGGAAGGGRASSFDGGAASGSAFFSSVDMDALGESWARVCGYGRKELRGLLCTRRSGNESILHINH